MGYTHYWTQRRDLTPAEWPDVCEHVDGILKHVQHVQGIPLANWEGTPGTAPQIDADAIGFNGVGDDSHETMLIQRKRPPKEFYMPRRGLGFCKTARKPYDVAVTAVLCYLETVVGTHEAGSDGDGHDWLAGLQLARLALPRFANVLDIPREVLEQDRWCMPWITNRSRQYEMHFCVDGRAYITRMKDGASYCFPSHAEAAEWARKHVEILQPLGSFDDARWRRITAAQTRLFAKMVNAAPVLYRDQQPPAFVRPGDIPEPPEPLGYWLADIA